MGKTRFFSTVILLVFFQVSILSSSVLAYDKYSGWWYVKGKEGTGVSVEVQGEQAFVAIFDYEFGIPFWISAFGNVEELLVERGKPAGLSFSGDLWLWNGWPLGTDYFAPTGWNTGTMNIDFLSESSAELTYSISKEFLQGDEDVTVHANLDKFMPDISPGDLDPREINGWWYDPQYDGMGFFVEAYGGTVFMAWYHYGSDGGPWWWSCYSQFSPTDKSFSCGIDEWSGGSPLGWSNYEKPTAHLAGNLGFTLNHDGTADLNWMDHQVFHLQRFIYPNN